MRRPSKKALALARARAERRRWIFGTLAGLAILGTAGIAAAAVLSGRWKPCTLTCFYPHDEKHLRQEGGPLDRRDRPAYTLQEYLSGEAPYVAVSGDTTFHYGTRIQVEYLDQVAGRQVDARIVDTGDHFHGAGKVYRFAGSEPFDVACDNDKGFGVVRSRYRVLGIAPPAPRLSA
jgi:hypothetical protein